MGLIVALGDAEWNEAASAPETKQAHHNAQNPRERSLRLIYVG